MKILAVVILSIATSGCVAKVEKLESAKDKALPESGAPQLPNDASAVADRLVSCVHFSGEFNGDRSERDKEVTDAMAELRCETIESEAAAIRRKYSGNAAVLKALDSANDL